MFVISKNLLRTNNTFASIIMGTTFWAICLVFAKLFVWFDLLIFRKQTVGTKHLKANEGLPTGGIYREVSHNRQRSQSEKRKTT